MRTINLQVHMTIDEREVDTLVDLARHVMKNAAGDNETDQARIRASQHAHFKGQTSPTDKGLLVDTREAAKLLKVSPRTIWNMCKNHEIPKPIRIGRAVRWSYEELRAWVNSGCPAIDGWNFEWDKDKSGN